MNQSGIMTAPVQAKVEDKPETTDEKPDEAGVLRNMDLETQG